MVESLRLAAPEPPPASAAALTQTGPQLMNGRPGAMPRAITAKNDTIELFFRRPPAGLRKTLEACLGRRVEIKDCLDGTGYYQGARAIVNRPIVAVLPILSRYRQHVPGCTTFRVDVAADLEMPDEPSAEAMHDWLDRHLILKWRSGQTRKVRVDDTTIYWADHRRARNLVLYPKAGNTLRLELRFLNTAAVRRAGLDDLTQLAQLDPAALFAHHVKAVQLLPAYVAKVLDRSRNVSPARALHVLDQLDMQNFVSGQRHTERKVETVSPFKIPTALTWEAVITPNDAPISSRLSNRTEVIWKGRSFEIG